MLEIDINDRKYAFGMIPIRQIEYDPDQPRRDLGISTGDMDRTTASLKKYGFGQPVTVMEMENESDRYLVVNGHRRYKSAQKLGVKQVPCMVLPHMSRGEMEAYRYQIQNTRRAWRPLERSNSLDRIKTELGLNTNKEVAQITGVSQSVVANSLQLRKLKVEYMELITRHELSESYVTEFIRLKPKLRRVRELEVQEIIENLFSRVSNKVVRSSKEFRKLSKIFSRATANEEWIYAYLKDPDMTVAELERQTIQSGRALRLEELLEDISTMAQKGLTFPVQGKLLLEKFKELLNAVV